ncbi:MAG: pentapeptide repeat-containing protein, partial [Myxococcota bacterium]
PDAIVAQVKEARVQAEEAQRKAEERAQEQEAKVRAEMEAQGLDYDEVMANAQAERGGPPKFRADEQMRRLDEAQLVLRASGIEIPPELAAQLGNREQTEARFRQMEERLIAMYREQAQYMPAAAAQRGDAREATRRRVLDARERGQSLAGTDLTGADLHGLDLSGFDLRGAFLEAVNLEGTDLRGAQLDDAVLTRARLAQCDLRGASCRGTNFGAAHLEATILSECDLTRAVFSEARVAAVTFEGATLQDSTWLNTTIERGSDFRRVVATKLIGVQLDLSECDFSVAELPELILILSRLDRARFEGADLREACLVQTTGEDVVFERVRGESLRVVGESALPRASFREASLAKSNFRGANLKQANFNGARLAQGDLSEADLTNATLEGMDAPGLMAIRTDFSGASLYGSNLMEAIMQKAILKSADLSEANLFRVDMLRVEVDAQTRLEGAYTDLLRYRSTS